ncbi:MAG: YbaB/EbfC family nucleoid-associated protein [Candidatus Eisenbacteria bacterium]
MSNKLGDIMRQAQKLQTQMKKIQDELADKTVEASAGGGMVTVIANGKQDIISIKIDPEVVSKDDVEMLEDLIVAAVNESRKRAQELMMGEMAKVTGGMGLPPGMF